MKQFWRKKLITDLWFYALVIFLSCCTCAIIGWYGGKNSTPLLTDKYYYDMPNGGYIWIDEDVIRFNPDEFNGFLNYRVTLNSEKVNGDERR